jgi:hypothetical protein
MIIQSPVNSLLHLLMAVEEFLLRLTSLPRYDSGVVQALQQRVQHRLHAVQIRGKLRHQAIDLKDCNVYEKHDCMFRLYRCKRRDVVH